jgi:hypothetical protein
MAASVKDAEQLLRELVATLPKCNKAPCDKPAIRGDGNEAYCNEHADADCVDLEHATALREASAFLDVIAWIEKGPQA